jgi:hypothetical protein
MVCFSWHRVGPAVLGPDCLRGTEKPNKSWWFWVGRSIGPDPCLAGYGGHVFSERLWRGGYLLRGCEEHTPMASWPQKAQGGRFWYLEWPQ